MKIINYSVSNCIQNFTIPKNKMKELTTNKNLLYLFTICQIVVIEYSNQNKQKWRYNVILSIKFIEHAKINVNLTIIKKFIHYKNTEYKRFSSNRVRISSIRFVKVWPATMFQIENYFFAERETLHSIKEIK